MTDPPSTENNFGFPEHYAVERRGSTISVWDINERGPAFDLLAWVTRSVAEFGKFVAQVPATTGTELEIFNTEQEALNYVLAKLTFAQLT